MDIREIDLIESDRVGPAELKEAFVTRYLKQNRPLVIRGGARSWPAVSRWSLDYVAEKCGEAAASGVVYGRRLPKRFDKVPVRKGVERIRRGDNFYFSPASLHTELPMLRGDTVLPPVIADKESEDLALDAFIGVNTYASMHYHVGVESLKVQVVGKKRGLLFSPQTDLRSLPLFWFNFSRIDFRGWATEREAIAKRSAALANVTAYECELEPGDMLFIPMYWWHSFFGDGLSMSATYVWPDEQPTFDDIPVNVKSFRRARSIIRPVALVGHLARQLLRRRKRPES